MKKNLFSIKKPKWGLIALFMTFCCFFANTAMAQNFPTSTATNDVFVWTGNVSNEWNNAGNWFNQSRATTGVAGTSAYPGQVDLDDWAYIPGPGANSGTKVPTGQTITIGRVFVTNQYNSNGGTLTIESGGSLVVNGATVAPFSLNGGSVVNNGAIAISTTVAGSTGFPVNGMIGGSPSMLPTVPTEWSYSGSGTLSISLPNANLAASAAIVVTANSATANMANVTYKFVVNNPTISINQATILGISAVRCAGSTGANPFSAKLIMSGTGLSLGSVGTPSIGSLISMGPSANVTVDTGTTLTLNSISTNPNSGLTSFSGLASDVNFINKGTINILGASSRNGIGFASGSSTNASVFNITNEGTINVNLNLARVIDAAFAITNGGGGTANAGSVVNMNNTSTGILTLKNTATGVGSGFAIYCTTAGEAARVIFNNDGVINLEGSVYSFGTKTTVNNNGTINSNNEFRNFSAINNNSGASINFVRTAATATTKQVTFNGLATSASASVGAIFSLGANQFTVISQKFNTFGTTLITNTLTSADTSGISTTAGGTLTLVSGTGSATIAFTEVLASAGPPAVAYSPSFSASSAKGALASNTVNSGTINTDTGSDHLNSLSGVSSTTGSSSIAPGGSSGKGVAEFNRSSWVALNGTARIQVSGNTTAGVDYDQLNNSTTYGGLDVTYANLDVSGIYLPSGTLTAPIDIMSTGTLAPLVGTFATVVGLKSGWSVQYTEPNGLEINPETTLPYVPSRRVNGKVQLMYTQTPYITQFSSDGVDTITQGCEGSTLVILGQKFTGATGVTVNGIPLTGITVVSDTRIDAVLPLGATSGLVAVSTAIATGNSAGNFTVVVNSDNTTAVTSFLTYTWPNNGQTYTASGIYSGTTTDCITEKLDLTITTTQIPASFPEFCKGATVANAVGSTSMVFYLAATGGSPLAGTTALTNNKTYYVNEVINSLENPTRAARVITVYNLPLAPATVLSNPIGESKLICKYIGSSTPVPFDAAVVAGAVSYLWTVPAGATIVSGDTTSSVGVSFAGASTTPGVIGTVTVKSVDTNGCASLAKVLTLTTKLPTAPASLVMTSTDSTPHFDVAVVPATIPASFNTVGLNTLLKITKVGPYMGTNTEFILTAPEAVTAASYAWTLPTGVNQTGGGTSNIITVNFAGVPSGIGALPIVVKSVGGCGQSIARTLTLARAVPGTPKALVLTSTNTTPRFTGVGGLVGLNSLTKITKVGPYQSTTLGFTLTATPFKVQGATATSYAWVLPAGVVCTTTNTPTTVKVKSTVNTGTVEVPFYAIEDVPAIATASNVINILFNTTGTGNLDLLVFGVNGAGNSVARKLVVTRSLPTAPTKLVLTDDAISSILPVTKVGAYVGKSTSLTLTGTPFTVQGAEGRTFYWTLPAGVNVTSGATLFTDNGATKTWKSSFTMSSSGMILTVNFAGVAPAILPSTTLSLPMSVQSENLAGASATTRTLTLSAAIPTPPAIVGSVGTTSATTYSLCETAKTYTATSFPGATYTWTVPAGATIVGATDTNVLVVNYAGASASVGGAGAVTCFATNGVGNSLTKSLTVKRVAATCREANTSITEEFKVKAYPNPSSSEFTIETSRKGATSVQVYDMQGRLIENRKSNSNTVQVGSKLATGTYNVMVRQDANVKTVRVIKK